MSHPPLLNTLALLVLASAGITQVKASQRPGLQYRVTFLHADCS